MKIIKINNIDEVIYYEKLENGLDVYLYPKSGYYDNYVTFTTKYGSVYSSFVPIGEKELIRVPNGIAHFLEHKVFVQKKDPQPMDFFAESGASANAYTTFKNTTYLFSGPNKLEDNIKFLLDYVQSPYFTDKNVNSEKDIIKREISMCNDRPNDVLYEKIMHSVFINNPFKESIIGTNEDIDNINKELLYTCYNTFYHPSNMFLIVTGNFDYEKIINLIKENQTNKKFKKELAIKLNNIKEPDKVAKERDIAYFETEVSRGAYNLKIPYSNQKMGKRKFNLYLFILFSCLFDETSLFDEQMKDKKIITSSLVIDIINCDTHLLISLINKTNKYEELFREIDRVLDNVDISEEDLERKKKVLLSNEIFSFENIEIVSDMIIDNILFENKIEENIIDIINGLNIEELKNLISNLNLKNKTEVILTKKDEKKS